MSQLAEKIAAEIQRLGPMPFSRFMELALYCPVYGYYEKEEDKIGASGDYYTSVTCGKLFGQLLGCQFADWLEEATQEAPLCIVEAGAHRGALARDVLGYLAKHRPRIYESTYYAILEPSERRRGWQATKLRDFGPKVFWVDEFRSVPAAIETQHPHVRDIHAGLTGIVFSNELLDAMPVHRLGWDARKQRWFEWGVELEGSVFKWTRLQAPAPVGALPKGVPNALLRVLPDGFTLETHPAAVRWWEQAARALHCGILMTIDYGLERLDFFDPGRSGGTLRAYRSHGVTSDVLDSPGDQDITAQVNFSEIRHAGESAGLTTTAYMEQSQFLTGVAERIWSGRARFDQWTPAHTRQFQTLTHPEHLGRAFRVLVQQRGGGAGEHKMEIEI